MFPIAEYDVKSDRELVECVNLGDSAAFEELYHRHRDWVYRLAWRFTRDHQDAQDVLQETFLYLLRKFPGFELTAALTTFLYPTVKHLSLNLRRRKSLVQSDKAIEAEEIPDPSRTEVPRPELAAVLRSLPIEQQEVILMRFVDDMSLSEIAIALGIALSTAKSRLYQGLHKLGDDPRVRGYFLE
jgi:RNA polymerase sigma-70 factor (ECF subfamily)